MSLARADTTLGLSEGDDLKPTARLLSNTSCALGRINCLLDSSRGETAHSAWTARTGSYQAIWLTGGFDLHMTSLLHTHGSPFPIVCFESSSAATGMDADRSILLEAILDSYTRHINSQQSASATRSRTKEAMSVHIGRNNPLQSHLSPP